jgi:hypothetical protein
MSNHQQQHELLLRLTSLIEDQVITALCGPLKKSKRELWEIYRSPSPCLVEEEKKEEEKEKVQEKDKEKEEEKDKDDDCEDDEKSKQKVKRTRIHRLPIPHGMIFRALYQDYELTIIYNSHDGGYYKYGDNHTTSGLSSFKSLTNLMSYWKMITNKPLASWNEFKVYNRVLGNSLRSIKNSNDWNTWLENSQEILDDYCDVHFDF